MSPATAVPFRFPQPARANQSGLCLKHHPSPSHNLLRHGDPFHRCLRDIPAWRRGLLSALWHGDPQLKRFWGRVAWRREGNRYRCRDYVGFATGLGTAPPATGGSEVSPRDEASSKQPQTGLALLNRSRSSIPVGPRHGDPFHRCLSGIPAWRSVLLIGLRHGDPTYRCLSGIPAWRSVLLTGPRHGDPFHRYLGGIPAWRRGLLSALWHGDPAHRCLSGILAWRTVSRPVHDQSLTDHLSML